MICHLKNLLKANTTIVMLCATFIIISVNCEAQVATITINNVNATIMNNTQKLFGITFDARTSLTGSGNSGQIGYYNADGTVIPEVDHLFGDFPLTTLRYPGNAIAVGFEWKKTIGLIANRPNQDLLGSVGQPQPVIFGFDEFMAMCESKGLTGADIQIMVPIYDSSNVNLNSTQSLAAIPNVIASNADWVEYCNSPDDGNHPWAALRSANGHPQPYNIKIWNIGNEPWSAHEYGPTGSNCNSFLNDVSPIINAMLAVDPTIHITMPTTGNGSSGTWADAIINSQLAQQGKIYALSQHYFGDEDLTTNSPNVNSTSSFINSLVNIAAAKNIKVFIGDYAHGINPQSGATMAQQDLAMQWQGAILESDFLLMLSQKSTIERANFWTYGNALAQWHPIRKNGTGDYTLMPGAAIYKILEPYFLDKSVQITSTSPMASDGNPYAIRANSFISSDQVHLNIVAVNRDQNDTIPFQVQGTNGYVISNSKILTATSLTSESIIQSVASTDINGNYIMPPMSVLILEYTSSLTGIDEGLIKNAEIKLYPNPSNSMVYLSQPIKNIKIFNAVGMLLINVSEASNSINVEDLPNGIYIIESDEGTFKFTISR